MKIDAMVEREEFYKINEKTLQKYYYNVFGINTEIYTKDVSILSYVFIYPKINAIVTRIPSWKVLRYVFAEFNIKGNPLKYIAAKLYAAVCLSSFGLLSDKSLLYVNDIVMNRNILIWPCNRKIRIFDFENNYVDSIVKDSFTNKYFINELSFRLSHYYSFIPPIEKYGTDWYREKILPGQPLARIRNKKLYKHSTSQAIIYIKEMISGTLIYVDPIEYAEKLCQDIHNKLEVAKCKKKINCSDEVYDLAIKSSSAARLINKHIPLAVSHGDLQAGNLWVDTSKKKTYIIDWETNEIRSIWYDPATLLLATRRHNGIINMFMNRESRYIMDAVLINDNIKDYNMSGVMGILILEEIMFYLDDMLELPLDSGSDIFNRIGIQFKQIHYDN